MKSSSHKVIVDRIEGELAVLVLYDDDRVKMNVPIAWLPAGTREGDHLRLNFVKDQASRTSEEERIAKLQEELIRRNG